MFVWSAQATFLPDDEIRYGMLSQGPANVDEAQFNATIQKAQELYKDTVKALGGNLVIIGDWQNEKINAGAQQTFGGWMVYMFGGLARRPELTQDGFTMVLCHEIGHHLGGFSFTDGLLPFLGGWAANEGQADYYAAHVCARKFWRNEAEINATYRTKINSYAIDKCNSVWTEREEQDLCYRTLAAVESLATTMAAVSGKYFMPSFEHPDTRVVTKTEQKHPDVQCRMDTGLQAALCPVAFNDSLIPGRKTKGGRKGIEAEKEAARYSCTASGGFTVGLRPACWFKPRL